MFGSVVIGAELGRKDHDSILCHCNRRGLKPLDDVRIQLVVKT
jgi:hypothetical protein